VRDPDPSVTASLDDGILTVRMGRPHGNAINAELLRGLIGAFEAAREEPAVRGVLFASSGKIFCPGLDLQELRDFDRGELGSFMELLSACVIALYSFPKPVVAAISGHALAGGCILALAADWRVLRWGALVGLAEIRVGLPLPLDVALVLREAVHPSRLAEVALLGSNFTDDAAVAAGLVHEVHEAEGFEAHCIARLREFASREPLAFARTKAYLRSQTVDRIRGLGGAHIEEFVDSWFSEGTQASIRRIVDELKSRRS
jgi:enoyl-CoA hydratase